MKLALYYAPRTCATVPYITLTEAGAEFDVMNVNSRAGDLKRPEYLRLNPKHKVPVLVVDGEPLTENVAIQVWIARQFPAARLLPVDSWNEIKAISLMSWFSSTLHAHLTPNARPENYCDLPGSDEAVKRTGNRLLFEDFAIADALLAGRALFFERLSAPDVYFFWCFRRARSFGLDLSRFAHCAAHFERMQELPSVKKLVAHEKMVLDTFARSGAVSQVGA